MPAGNAARTALRKACVTQLSTALGNDLQQALNNASVTLPHSTHTPGPTVVSGHPGGQHGQVSYLQSEPRPSPIQRTVSPHAGQV
jgi:hypothetical protein